MGESTFVIAGFLPKAIERYLLYNHSVRNCPVLSFRQSRQDREAATFQKETNLLRTQ